MIDLLRIMSLFGGGQQQPGWQTPGFNPYEPTPTFSGMFNPRPQGQEAIVDNFNQPYQPDRTMQDRFAELLQGFPQRDENPSRWRKIGALLTGLGGEDAGQAMQLSSTALNLPFLNKVQDWGMQVKPTMEAAENERLHNQYMQTQDLNERRVSETERRNRETADAAARAQTERERANLFKEQLAARRAEVQEGYLSLAELKANNSHTFKTREDGMIMAINNMDPTRPQETGIRSGELSDARKIALGLDADIKLAGVRGDEARETAITRAEQQRQTEAVRPRTPSSGGGELEERRRVDNRLQQMAIEKPELFRYIQNGTIKSGTPTNVRAEINRYVYGETRTPSSVSSVASGVPFNAPRDAPKAPPNTPLVRASDKAVLMISKDGQFGYVPASQVSAAESQGYKRAQ